jgi:hypothetical protein
MAVVLECVAETLVAAAILLTAAWLFGIVP